MKRVGCLLAVILGMILAQPVQAEPSSGFAIYGGPANLTVVDADTGDDYGAASFGGGMDYQWAWGRLFSLVLRYDEYAGSLNIPELPEVTTVKVSTLAAQLRLWLGRWYLGFQRGNSIVVVAQDNLSFDLSGGVVGGGFTLGIEGKGGWFASLGVDRTEGIQLPDGPLANVSGSRVRLGYRWK